MFTVLVNCFGAEHEHCLMKPFPCLNAYLVVTGAYNEAPKRGERSRGAGIEASESVVQSFEMSKFIGLSSDLGTRTSQMSLSPCTENVHCGSYMCLTTLLNRLESRV